MSVIRVLRCDTCGRPHTAYGANIEYYVEYGEGKHACGWSCYLVLLSRAASRYLR